MATKQLKDNNMICTGGIPPQIVQGMELYQNYMKSVMHFYQAWCCLSGATYWADQVNNYYKHDTKKSNDE